LAAGIGPGDEVIVPSFSFAATANSVRLTGATPIFVDIDLRTYNIDPSAVEAAITTRTRAIQPVHLYGLPADMSRLTEIAKKNSLEVFEDAAQAHLARINDRPVGTFGRAATFSFYATKNMTSGEGGMVVCQDEDLARRIKLFRNQGMEKKYQNEMVGFNNRMTDIQAAIGLVQLTKISNFTKKRQEIARFYLENIENVVLPFIPEKYNHVFHQFTIRVEDAERDRFIRELNKKGIGSAVYYPTPIHSLPSYDIDLYLENTFRASKEVLSLPIHPKISKRDMERVVSAVNRIAVAGA
jgi:dTDP-4-amino-4,6-dideoxygalactose transaminase